LYETGKKEKRKKRSVNEDISVTPFFLAMFRILKCISDQQITERQTPGKRQPRFTEIARRTPESSVSDLSFFVIKVVRQNTPVKKKI
jgi:hypothetical protein